MLEPVFDEGSRSGPCAERPVADVGECAVVERAHQKVFTTCPRRDSIASRTISSCRANAGRIASGCSCHRRVEPSRSVTVRLAGRQLGSSTFRSNRTKPFGDPGCGIEQACELLLARDQDRHGSLRNERRRPRASLEE